MAEGALPRVTRLLGLVAHLDEHGEASFAELAEHFGTTVDVIKRDIELLWVSGLPGYHTNDLLDFDADAFDEGVARLLNSQGVHQVQLAPAEVVALVGALRSLIASGIAPVAAQEVLKILSTAIAEAEPITVFPATPVDPNIRETLSCGIENHLAVQVTYVDAKDRRTARIIEPHRLVVIDGIGYVECFCRRALDYRTLRLDRFESAQVIDSPTVVPAKNLSDFGLEGSYQAVVKVSLQGRWAFETLPGVQAVHEVDTTTFSFGVANTEVVVGRLLAVAPNLKSVEPTKLRERLAAAATAILEVST